MPHAPAWHIRVARAEKARALGKFVEKPRDVSLVACSKRVASRLRHERDELELHQQLTDINNKGDPLTAQAISRASPHIVDKRNAWNVKYKGAVSRHANWAPSSSLLLNVPPSTSVWDRDPKIHGYTLADLKQFHGVEDHVPVSTNAALSSHSLPRPTPSKSYVPSCTSIPHCVGLAEVFAKEIKDERETQK